MMLRVVCAAVLLAAASGASAKCFGGAAPQEGYSGRCKWYEGETCCASNPLFPQLTNQRIKPDCLLDQACKDELLLIQCYQCSPNQDEFMKATTNGVTVKLCEEFINRAWDSCRQSEVDDYTGSGCVRMQDVVGITDKLDDPKYWLKAMSLATPNVTFEMDGDSDCFAGASSVGATAVLTLAAVAAAVLA
jgi:Folate receptor family